MKNLTIYKDEKNNSLTIDIAELLEKSDYDLWWKEEGGEESDTIQDIRDICENYKGGKLSFIDIQIWEEGNAKVENIDLSKLQELIIDFEERFGKLEICEG